MTVAECHKLIKEGHFEAGTMLPKIEASIAYLAENPAGSVLIASINTVADAIKGKSGTIITA